MRYISFRLVLWFQVMASVVRIIGQAKPVYTKGQRKPALMFNRAWMVDAKQRGKFASFGKIKINQ